MAIRVPQCLFGVACLAVIQVWPIYSFAQPKTANANIFQQLIVGQHVSLMRGPNGYYEINLVSEGNVGPYVVREISHYFFFRLRVTDVKNMDSCYINF